MPEIETLGILDEIQALVSDHLQVVSYKWLSRNFLVSSNTAKRLLQEFVEKHGNGLEVVYTLSGWLKSSPPSYNIRLVSEPKLAEAKQEFDGNCSIQVYSVQACIPKDPAALWNAEFVQAEELFKQPSAVDNCLRDNRFCGISNSFVKRGAEGTPVSNASLQLKIAAIPDLTKTNTAHHNNTVPPCLQNKVQQSSPKVGLMSSNAAKEVKGQSNGTGAHDQVTKPSVQEEKLQPLPANIQNKSSSGNGGSLANLWGRASSKSKPNSAPADASAGVVQDVSNEDDAEDVNFRRASNGEGKRKRKVVFDLSDEDEYEDAVNLASPDLPKGQSSLAPEQSKKVLVTEKPNLIFDELIEDKPKVKEEKATDLEPNQSEDSSVVSTRTITETSITEKIQKCVPEKDVHKDKVADSSAQSPKRRKVVKTRIDERGREVTEVLWEGEESEMKKPDSGTMQKADNTMKKAESNTVADNVKRPAAAKKSPALGSNAPSNAGNKAGNKKAGNQKDPKQGNILSFFKRV
ncbi:DNA polymerase delta subunit 3 [Citrus sinensis]|uniref:DNA polymerase delta subunit 3 n=1 Tax=Citrus sinensis TaxID=2711 RepID=A0ACB8M1L7_CITSI|nr:DNA polymerase delta subunit 3 [Citrus sinensis]